MKTSLIEKLNLALPIVQAPMAGVSTPAMAAAVSNAGALGSIAIGAMDVKVARETILATRQLTNHSFNVNVFCHRPAVLDAARENSWLGILASLFAQFKAQPPQHLKEIYTSFLDDDEMLELLLELRIQVVSFHFGLPSAVKIARLKKAGVVLLATATNLDEAREIAAAGIDAIVAQGYEAGGHRGVFEPSQPDRCLGLSALVRLLVTNLDIPVIAAGGIMDGAGISACLALGAQAAQLGTAFINCPESSADAHYRAALRSEAAFTTVMTSAISGRPARCLANSFTKFGESIGSAEIPDYPLAYDAGKALHAAAKACGDGSYGAQWAGQGAPLARTLPAAELVARLAEEMRNCGPGNSISSGL
ncbi:MAG: nitronate monooxygenase family protein [Candidatus Obscuribacterales bacterium]|nr:nitronate monooxygenase family protein [Candidatus Obscuribacterales bacterium]